MRVLITGSRNWNDWASILEAFDTVRESITKDPYSLPSRHEAGEVIIVSGNCPSGADWMCERMAFDYGFRVERHPANWKELGKRAGFARNEFMVTLGADRCFAFIKDCHAPHCRIPKPHESHGASHCMNLAIEAGIPTQLWRQSGDVVQPIRKGWGETWVVM